LRINFKDVPDSQDFGTIPLGLYPALMKISAYMVDDQKNFALDGSGQKVFWTTSKGDPMWKMVLEIVDGPHKGREIFDNLNFSPGGLKRVKVIYVRGGFAEGDEEDIDIEPEEIDGTYWWIDVDRHEAGTKESKYTFKNRGCGCETCKANDGKKVNINPRIAFAGFEPMKAADAARYKQSKITTTQAHDPSICMPCDMGEHTHPARHMGCPCLHVNHPLSLCDDCVKGDHRHKLDPRLACSCQEEMHTPF
jgi:hypothetical protein